MRPTLSQLEKCIEISEFQNTPSEGSYQVLRVNQDSFNTKDYWQKENNTGLC